MSGGLVSGHRRGLSRSALSRLAAIVMLLALTQTSTGLGQGLAQPDDVRPLLDKFNIEAVKTDYVVAIDTSLSMRRLFPDVRRAVESFVAALDSGDHLSLIAFDVYPRLLAARPIPEDKSAIIRLVPSGPHPEGRSTDIGSALKMVLEQLNRQGANAIQYVLFLTDGIDEPPPGTPFATNPGPEWLKLRTLGSELSGRRVLRVFGIGLKERTDIALLRRVFPDAGILTLGTEDLAAYFREIKLASRLEKLKASVREELRTGQLTLVPVDGTSWGGVYPGGEVQRAFRIRSGYRRLSAAVHISSVRLVGSSQTQGPGEPGVLTVSLEQERLSHVIPPGGESPPLVVRVKVPPSAIRWHLRRGGEVSGRLALDVDASLEHAAGLQRLGFDPRATVSTRESPLLLTVAYGLSVPAAAALAGLVLGAAVLVAFVVRGGIARARPPALPGRLLFLRAPGGQLPGSVDLTDFTGRATIGPGGNIRLSGEGLEDIIAVLEARRAEEGEIVFLIPKVAGIQVNGVPVLPGTPYQLAAGSTIETVGHVMQWLA